MATRNQAPRPMTEYELTSMIGQQIAHARSYLSAEIASDRQENLRYYLNRPLGNEVEGRSQVISTDVQDTIESVMPDLVEMFAASGAIWKYQPNGPEDVPFVKQMDQYVFDVVWNVDNPGFKITHDVLKDVLLEKTGILKIWWDDTRPTTKEIYEQVSEFELAVLDSDPNVEIIESDPSKLGDVEMPGFWDIKIERKQETGRCKIEVIPSEEFLVNTRTRELDETCSFCAHRRYTARSELVEQGYDPEFVWQLPTIEGNNNANLDRSRVRHARFSDDRSALTDYGVQPESEREIEIYECYVLMDYEGTGVSKRYLVRTAGFDGSTIIPDLETGEDAVEIDDHPFVKAEAIRQTGRFFGRALADLCRDIQKIKSTIQRQTLDNMYQINNQRAVLSSRVDIDDWLNNDVGAGIPVDAETAVGHVDIIAPAPIGQITAPLLEYWDGVLRDRTGIAGGAEPMDPKAFHETFGGANLMLGQMMKRLLFYARVIAETGFKDAGKKILRTIVYNQDVPRTVRLNNNWVPVDPRRWNAALDVKVVAGLGHGTKETRLAGAMQLAQMQERVVAQIQGGSLSGPFVTPEHISNSLDTVCDSMSMDRSLYFGELDDASMRALMAPQPPEPSELEKMAEMQAQIEQAKTQLQIAKERADNRIDVLKIQEDARQANQDAQLKLIEYELKYGIEQERLGHDRLLTDMKIQSESQRSEHEGRMRDMRLKELEGTAVKENAEELGVLRDRVEQAAQVMAAVGERMAEMDEPKKVKVRRENGRIVGASVTQGGRTTEISLE